MTNPTQNSRNALIAGKRTGPKADSRTAAKTPSRSMTDLAMQPSVAAAMVAIRCIAKSDSEIRIRDLIDTLDDSIGELQAGEMSRAEAMLFAQAHALQTMYVDLANRGIRSERMEHREANLRLALKAQNRGDRPSGQYLARPAAGEQRHYAGRPSGQESARARGESIDAAERTIGGEQ
jgi:hypothetical protein